MVREMCKNISGGEQGVFDNSEEYAAGISKLVQRLITECDDGA
jgi:hypothetical protein